MAIEEQIQRAMFTHWPGLLPTARREGELYVVRLMRWPPRDEQARGPLEGRSASGYEAALMDLATFTPVSTRCQEAACVLCARR
jgi:hypothetical protein